MRITLKIWRQDNPNKQGKFVTYHHNDVSPDMSFLEMLDTLNEEIENSGQEPVAFEHDCREGICGSCGFMINGRAHGPIRSVTTCQLHMRHFKDNDHIVLEPWRARPFTVLKDLIVDRSSFDKIIQAGGYVSLTTGSAPDANAIPIEQKTANLAMDAAACIGCGACVASCKNAAAMLFTGAKVSHLASLPQGQPERKRRVLSMVKTMDKEGFGNCTNERECEGDCPKNISFKNISKLNREFIFAKFS